MADWRIQRMASDAADAYTKSAAMAPTFTNWKQKKNDYARAARLLRRASRRGPMSQRIDAASAMVDFGQKAEDAGMPTSGIQDAESQGRQFQGDMAALEQGSQKRLGADPLLTRGVPGAAGPTSDSITPDEAKRANELDTFADIAAGNVHMSDAQFRSGLDKAMGEMVAMGGDVTPGLEDAAMRRGVTPEQFTKRKVWWQQKKKFGFKP